MEAGLADCSSVSRVSFRNRVLRTGGDILYRGLSPPLKTNVVILQGDAPPVEKIFCFIEAPTTLERTPHPVVGGH